ncbi:DUF433 domain-containing protein [Pendulispora albinea]|uniref:DUF433 domain-containing protein n=1 Tax=Pendulispora albinea TaxID=2741071 RepID=A0ABZ2M886_9BACT
MENYYESPLDLITSDPAIRWGLPCIRGQIPASLPLLRMAEGASIEGVMQELGISRSEILACLAYAARAVGVETDRLIHPL